MERFSAEMIANLYGNPHSASTSSQAAGARVDVARNRVLQWLNASPEEFDVVFVANATAGIKLVMDSFRDAATPENRFLYAYHKDSHTSLIGVREHVYKSLCVDDDDIEDDYIERGQSPAWPSGEDVHLELYAYPAQSNFNGRRLPLDWSWRIRCFGNTDGDEHPTRYTLLDAAALVSTAQLDLSNADKAPDFTVMSFNKIFGFPDLGALIVRKSRGGILRKRKYFGGGTVEVVVALHNEEWHVPKEETLHEALEDGTLPIHSIMALDHAMTVHEELYTSMDRISDHTTFLAEKLYKRLKQLKHANGRVVCRIYAPNDGANYGNRVLQGATVPFNLVNSSGQWVSNTEVQRLASIRKIHIRTGGMCNPGGVTEACEFTPWEISRNFFAGARCGGEDDVIDGKPLGVIRASLGAMSTLSDVEAFVKFISEFYVEKSIPEPLTDRLSSLIFAGNDLEGREMQVRSLTIYPIKSCGGYAIPCYTDWEVRPEGLAWDREWCFIHQGTGVVLSQKKYPKMALIRPSLNLASAFMALSCQGREFRVPLSSAPVFYESIWKNSATSKVCGDKVSIWRLRNWRHGNEFFSGLIGVPVQLARFPSGGVGPGVRHSKAHLQAHQQVTSGHPSCDDGVPTPPSSTDGSLNPRLILLSNESPILMINEQSYLQLSTSIARTNGRVPLPSVFRANIVIGLPCPNNSLHPILIPAPGSSTAPKPIPASTPRTPAPDAPSRTPYAEDHWKSLRIGGQDFTMLGSCRRCHMVCIDQNTAEKSSDGEPFVTLAKTRRMDGKVWFGGHMCHAPKEGEVRGVRYTIRVGDVVWPS